jgi:hypothetical protein
LLVFLVVFLMPVQHISSMLPTIQERLHQQLLPNLPPSTVPTPRPNSSRPIATLRLGEVIDELSELSARKKYAFRNINS